MERFKHTILSCLSALGEATADEVVRKFESEHMETGSKPVIAEIHELLTELDEKGEIKSVVKDGELFYRL